jgi:hypothetical protein
MSKFIIKSSAACMPSSCKWGPYRRVAVLEVEDGVDSVKMISPRARGVIQVVRTWERLFVGKTDRCAYERALAHARSLVSAMASR